MAINETDKGDKTQIGLTEAADEILDRMRAQGLIREEGDGYKLAVAFAISHIEDFEAETSKYSSVTTKFHTSSIDRDGLLKDLVEASGLGYPGQPYRTAERLAIFGLLRLEGQLESTRDMRRVLEGATPE